MTRMLTPLMLILGLAGLGLSACNTVEGMGRDIQTGGAVISNTAQEVEEDL